MNVTFSAYQIPLGRSQVVARHYSVLAQIKRGHTSRAAIAAKLEIPIALVAGSIEWLNQRDYIVVYWGQIDSLTAAGRSALAARQLAAAPPKPARTPLGTPWRQLEDAVSPLEGGTKGGPR